MTNAALLIVAVIGGFELVLSVSLRTYIRLRKDIPRDDKDQAGGQNDDEN